MKKLLLVIMMMCATVASFANKECGYNITNIGNTVECESAAEPLVEVEVVVVWGIPFTNCWLDWPVCKIDHFRLKMVDNSTPAKMIIYDDEVIVEFDKDDIVASGNEVARKKLINVSSVSFDKSFEIENELNQKTGNRFKVVENKSYRVSSKSGKVMIHFPLE